MDQLMAIEPGPVGIVKGPDDGAKDEARGVELSSSPIGSSRDSSREEAPQGKGEPRWLSVILVLQNLIRVGFGLSSLGREWVTNGLVFCIPPVLFKGIDIFLVVFCNLTRI